MSHVTPASPMNRAALGARVVDAQGTAYDGLVTDLTGGVASVQFWCDQLPEFPMHHDVALELTSSQRSLPSLPAHICSRGEIPGGRVYRCAYDISKAFVSALPGELATLFASREQPRTYAPEGVTIEATLRARGGDDVWPGIMIDLSLAGTALLVHRQVDEGLAGVEDVELTLFLRDRKGEEVLMTVPGCIRHRTTSGTRVRHGIAFRFEDDNQSKSAADQIKEWIAAIRDVDLLNS